jgi:hypothetical protein
MSPNRKYKVYRNFCHWVFLLEKPWSSQSLKIASDFLSMQLIVSSSGYYLRREFKGHY